MGVRAWSSIGRLCTAKVREEHIFNETSVAVSKFGLNGIPVKENSGRLGITRTGFRDSRRRRRGENVNKTSGNVRKMAGKIRNSGRAISNSPRKGVLMNGRAGDNRPWFSSSGTVSPQKGKGLQRNNLVDNVASSRKSCIPSSCKKISAANRKPVNGAKAVSQRGHWKPVVRGDGRSRIREELNRPGVLFSSVATGDLEATIRETTQAPVKVLRSILKHHTSTRPNDSSLLTNHKVLAGDDRTILSTVTTKQQKLPTIPRRQQSSQTPSPTSLPPPPTSLPPPPTSLPPSPTSLPPPPFRQSRIPHGTFFTVNGELRHLRNLPDRSKSSNGCCYCRQKFFKLESRCQARREVRMAKKKSDANLQTGEERSATYGTWLCEATDGQVGAVDDWDTANGSSGVPTCGVGVAIDRGIETSYLHDHHKITRRIRGENDVRRNVRRSPQMEEQEKEEEEEKKKKKKKKKHCSDRFQNLRRHYEWRPSRTHVSHVDNDHDNIELAGDNEDNTSVSDEQSTKPRLPECNTRCSWRNLIEIVTDNSQPPAQPVTLEMAPPPSVSSDAPGSTRPYYRRIFENMFRWMSRLAEMQWSYRKTFEKASENHIVTNTTVTRNVAEVSLRKMNGPDNFIRRMNPSELKLVSATPRSVLTGQPKPHLCSSVKREKDSPEPECLPCKPQMRQKKPKSCLLTTCSKVQRSPSELKPCLSANGSGAQINLAERKPYFSTTCSRFHENSSELEQYPFLEKTRSSEHQLTTPKRPESFVDQKLSNSRPKQKASRRQPLYSWSPVRCSDQSGSSVPWEIFGNRLDQMQAEAVETISWMRERCLVNRMRQQNFGFLKKLPKQETLLTKSLTKKFEDTAEMPSSWFRIAQLRTLLSELPLENFYVVEWLVTNNIINETNANGFGSLFHVKPHILELLSRHHDLFRDAF